jgi:hypothetical protein
MTDGIQIAQWIGTAYILGLATAGVFIVIRDRKLQEGDISGTAFQSILGALSSSSPYQPAMRANPNCVQ